MPSEIPLLWLSNADRSLPFPQSITFLPNLATQNYPPPPPGDVANSKGPLLIIPKVQLRLRVTRRSWQKLFAGKNFVTILVTAQTQLRSYSEQQSAFGNSNICNCVCLVLTLLNIYYLWWNARGDNAGNNLDIRRKCCHYKIVKLYIHH